MYLVQLLMPVCDNSGRRFPRSKLDSVETLLTRRFGGITMFKRSPAEGLSRKAARVVHDEILIFEVMTGTLDRRWWKQYRNKLEKEFSQDRLIVRASRISVL